MLVALLLAASAWYAETATRNYLAVQLDEKNTIPSLTRAVALSPDWAQAWNDLALAQEAQGEMAAALRSLQQARNWDPDNAQYARELSALLYSSDATASRSEAMAAVRLAPNNPDSLVALGSFDLLDGASSAALQQFRRAMELNPDLAAQVYAEIWGFQRDNSRLLHEAVPDSSAGYSGYIAFLATHAHWPELGQSLDYFQRRPWSISPGDAIPIVDDLSRAHQWKLLAKFWPRITPADSPDPLQSQMAGHGLAWGSPTDGTVSAWTVNLPDHGLAIRLQVSVGAGDNDAAPLLTRTAVVQSSGCLDFDMEGLTQSWQAYANPMWDWTDADTGRLLLRWSPPPHHGWYRQDVILRLPQGVEAIQVQLLVPGNRGLDPRVTGDMTVKLPQARPCP